MSAASANVVRNSCWFLSESAVTSADDTLATNIGAVFPYWVDVHIDQWMYPERTNNRRGGSRYTTQKPGPSGWLLLTGKEPTDSARGAVRILFCRNRASGWRVLCWEITRTPAGDAVCAFGPPYAIGHRVGQASSQAAESLKRQHRSWFHRKEPQGSML